MIESFVKKLNEKNKDYYGKPQVTVAFIGDSVTQGCFELAPTSETGFYAVCRPWEAYSEKFKRLLNNFYPNAYLNIVNAGLSGDGSENGFKRLGRDVLPYKPDLVVVAFGLNDCGRKADGLDAYVNNIRSIVKACREAGSEVIFMSANGMCEYADGGIAQKSQFDIAANVAKTQNEGWCRKYFEAAGKAAVEEGGYFADANGRWEAMSRNGADMTKQLSNRINHPTADLHWLFAATLFETIFF